MSHAAFAPASRGGRRHRDCLLQIGGAGLADQRIVTTLCPGGKERMRRLIDLVAHGRIDLRPLVTHEFTLEELPDAFDLFSRQGGGVMKVAIYPSGVRKGDKEAVTSDRERLSVR